MTSKAPVHKVAVIQLYPEPLAVEANYTKAATFIRRAASQGAHLAVLPEYHLTSWAPADTGFIPACREWKTYLDRYIALAAELNICIVPGTIVQASPNDSSADTLINVAYFIAPTGILSSYQKKNLWHPERPHLTSSAHAPHEAFDTPLGRVGMLICWDLAFPEAFRELVAGGAQIIIVPTFWTLEDCNAEGRAYNRDSEGLFLQSTLVSRAFENTCAVVFANAGGPEADVEGGDGGGGLEWAGMSQISVPFIGPQGKLGKGEGMSVVELDMRVLEVAEDNYKVRADMRGEGWHYGYSLTRDHGKTD